MDHRAAIDHVAMTVPDVDQATAFFEAVFGAKVVVEGLSKNDPPWMGHGMEVRFGMPEGGCIRARRVLNLGGRTNIEMFEFAGTPHQRPPHTYDYGIQHFAVYVSDLQKTARAFILAGGRVFESEDFKKAVLRGEGPAQGWLYGETPWGSIIEMVTFQEA